MSGIILHPNEPPLPGMVKQKTLFPIIKKLVVKLGDATETQECCNMLDESMDNNANTQNTIKQSEYIT